MFIEWLGNSWKKRHAHHFYEPENKELIKFIEWNAISVLCLHEIIRVNKILRFFFWSFFRFNPIYSKRVYFMIYKNPHTRHKFDLCPNYTVFERFVFKWICVNLHFFSSFFLLKRSTFIKKWFSLNLRERERKCVSFSL